MSDIHCIVCGEPWDAYGVNHGDMLPWEAKLFRAGAGCPSCEGQAPETPWEPRGISDVENGDGDPMERIMALERYQDGKAPKWERPTDPILWTCDACGVQVVRDQDDDELKYDLPHGARGAKWYHSHNYDRGAPDEEPEHVFGASSVCEFCLSHCDGCGEPVSSILEVGDTYDPGWCTTLEPYGCGNVYCIACVESTCSECELLPDDCSCHDEHDDEEVTDDQA